MHQDGGLLQGETKVHIELRLGMADGYRCIIVTCLLLFPPYRKYCSHVDEKKIESLPLLENDLSTFK